MVPLQEVAIQTRTHTKLLIGAAAFVGVGLAVAAIFLFPPKTDTKEPNHEALIVSKGVQKELSSNTLATTDTVLTRSVHKSYINSGEIGETITDVRGVAVSGTATLRSFSSYVRVLMNGALIASVEYPDQGEVKFESVCTETCALENLKSGTIALEIKDADVRIDTVSYIPRTGKLSSEVTRSGATVFQAARKKDQNAGMIERLNAANQANGQYWIAGDTGSIIARSYAEQKALVGTKELPADLRRFFYYKSGVFPLDSHGANDTNSDDLATAAITNPTLSTTSEQNLIQTTTPPTGLTTASDDVPPPAQRSVEETLTTTTEDTPFIFDWRNQHGQNWLTLVKNQGVCGSCWAYGAVGATEAAINTYFNQHLDVDLSEQQVLSCSDSGSCGGGSDEHALRYIRDSGVADEACYPYNGTNGSCASLCSDWQNRAWKISNRVGILRDTTTVKTAIKERGPLSFGYTPWNHVMTLTGFGEITPGHYEESGDVPEGSPYIGKTYWVVKNSWGSDWGEDGFGRLLITDANFFNYPNTFYAIDNPTTPPPGQSYEVKCYDADNDGYCWWGLGQKPATGCPDSCISQVVPDCNDANADLQACTTHYICGNHQYLTGYEAQHFGDYATVGEGGCCGDNVGEYPIINEYCCNAPTDILASSDYYAYTGQSSSTGAKPRGLSVQGDTVYVALKDFNVLGIYQRNGNSLTQTYTHNHPGSGNGQLHYPYDTAVLGNTLVVADMGNNRIQIFEISGSSLIYRGKIGQLGSDDGQFSSPTGVSIDGDLIAVSDYGNNRIQLFRLNGFTPTFIRAFGSAGSGDGQFNNPGGLSLRNGRLFVADGSNNRVQEFALDESANITYVRSIGSLGSGDGQLNYPVDVAYIGDRILIADYYNDRIQGFRIAGSYVTPYLTLGGTGASGDGTIDHPNGVTANDGWVYISDSENRTVQMQQYLVGNMCSPTCSDGTARGSCSQNKPSYCTGSELVQNCQHCGCPDNTICGSDNVCHAACADGTPYGKCSNNKPLYCQDGQLQNRCQTCGCSTEYKCIDSGKCQHIDINQSVEQAH